MALVSVDFEMPVGVKPSTHPPGHILLLTLFDLKTVTPVPKGHHEIYHFRGCEVSFLSVLFTLVMSHAVMKCMWRNAKRVCLSRLNDVHVHVLLNWIHVDIGLPCGQYSQIDTGSAILVPPHQTK